MSVNLVGTAEAGIACQAAWQSCLVPTSHVKEVTHCVYVLLEAGTGCQTPSRDNTEFH